MCELLVKILVHHIRRETSIPPVYLVQRLDNRLILLLV